MCGGDELARLSWAKDYTGRQLDGILAELAFQWRVMLELDSYTGLRWG